MTDTTTENVTDAPEGVETPQVPESEPTTDSDEATPAPRPEWAVVIVCGATDLEVEAGARVVDVTPADTEASSVVERLVAEGISPADLRARVLFVASPEPEFRDRALVTYAALCGFAGRRLDARVGDEHLTLAEFDRLLRSAPDAGRPAELIEQAQAGGTRDDMPCVDLSGGFTPQVLSVVRFARRLRFAAPEQTPLALTQFVAIAAVRGRAGMDRFPMLVQGDEPGLLPVSEDGIVGTVGVCLHQARRVAEQYRRESRGDVRDAVTDFVEPSPRQKHLIEAATTDVAEVLDMLGVRSSVVEVRPRGAHADELPTEVTAYHCPLPENHTNGDATPSARILDTHDGTPGFRCYRCLPETVDSLRLVMWARSCSPDEAADWIAAGKRTR